MIPKGVASSRPVTPLPPLTVEPYNALDIDVATKIGITQHTLDVAVDTFVQTKATLVITFARSKEVITYQMPNVIWISQRGPMVRNRRAEEFVAGQTYETTH